MIEENKDKYKNKNETEYLETLQALDSLEKKKIETRIRFLTIIFIILILQDISLKNYVKYQTNI